MKNMIKTVNREQHFDRPKRAGAGFRFELSPRVSSPPRKTTNLSKSGLPPILLSRTNGEVRGSHSRGKFPRSGHTSHNNPRGKRSKDHNIVLSSQVHPLTRSEPGLHFGC
ncbi:hypothetical protein ILYODFUR_002049 [Ilyodon furcidens]|uniref:Uncharacterized protein n=1 Tax=Ilyodon furcidens TaxID=33524 RepID=A0ABV0UPS8_9TELE